MLAVISNFPIYNLLNIPQNEKQDMQSGPWMMATINWRLAGSVSLTVDRVAFIRRSLSLHKLSRRTSYVQCNADPRQPIRHQLLFLPRIARD